MDTVCSSTFVALFTCAEMVDLDEVDESDLNHPSPVLADDLPNAIAKARNVHVELAARLEYWQHLNQSCREIPCGPRCRRSCRPCKRPFSYPPFKPSEIQQDNMRALLPPLNSENKRQRHLEEIVELHRELGEFEEAAKGLDE